ncbi:MAG: hypothetical protein IJ529_03835, partial [Alphaproteobacteria bacterium]|nr:hypothetical protein [Alphaproteobacteria bacterium]
SPNGGGGGSFGNVPAVADNTQLLANAQAQAQAVQETANATGEAAQKQQELAVSTQETTAAMGELPAVIQNAMGGIGEQAATTAQTVNTNLATIPPETQTIMQQLPPIAKQGTDGIAQEWAELATKCQPGGEAFVQAANTWGQQAYEAIANWADQMASVVTEKLSNAWAQISAQFNAGLNVNVTTSGANIAHNAVGGIYNKGAFLTTFAEKSPEAAIPLDGSKRAVSLWQQVGSILGVNAGAVAEITAPEVEMPSLPSFLDTGSQELHMEYHAPSITINGNADSGTVSQLEAVLARAKADWMREVQKNFGGMYNNMKHGQRRLSYVT